MKIFIMSILALIALSILVIVPVAIIELAIMPNLNPANRFRKWWRKNVITDTDLEPL